MEKILTFRGTMKNISQFPMYFHGIFTTLYVYKDNNKEL